MKLVLIISPYFPPSTLAGVHRARHLAKHLPQHGWWPIVLCVDEAFHEERLDPELASLIPSSVEIVKVSAIPASVTRVFGAGDISLRSYAQLRRTALNLIRTRDIQAVFITGSPYYPMMLAPEIRRRFRIPVVLDFQDPWVSTIGQQQRVLSKAGLSHRLAQTLEPRALRAASFVTSVSDTQNAEMAARYRWYDQTRMAAIPIGCDAEDFNGVATSSSPAADTSLAPGKINVSYVGTIMPRSHMPIGAVLRAFAMLRRERPFLADRIRLNFIGTSNQTGEQAPGALMTLARGLGLDDFIYERPGRLPYVDALRVLVKSDGLLLIGSDERHYTASKIYPALMSGRPYLSLFHSESSAHAVLSSAGGGEALAFSTPAELALLEQPLMNALAKLAQAPESFGKARRSAYAAFEASMIAKRFADVFDAASEGEIAVGATLQVTA